MDDARSPLADGHPADWVDASSLLAGAHHVGTVVKVSFLRQPR